MKKRLLIPLVFFISYSARSQKYGNEWVSYSQQYFKFPIHKEGIYRIDSTTLATQFNLASLNPKNFQLFLNGEEQFLFIAGESDNQVNGQDYIEFYAKPNMSSLDSSLYYGIKYVPNPYAPLFNDTIYGFLTSNSSLNNKRFQVESDTSSTLYPIADYVYTEQLSSIATSYNNVREYTTEGYSDPRYTQAEGKGMVFAAGNSIQGFSGTPHLYTLTPLPAKVSICFSGYSKNFSSSNYDHHITFKYNDANNTFITLLDTLFYGFVPVKKQYSLNAQNLSVGTTFTLAAPNSTLISTPASSSMFHYLHFFYPKQLNLNNEPFSKLFIDDAPTANKAFYKFSNFNYSGTGNILLYDLTNGKKIETVYANNFVRVVIPDGGARKLCVLANESDTIRIKKLTKVNGNGYFTNFKNTSAVKPFAMVYHKNLVNSYTAYNQYRKSSSGGSYDVIGASIDELYEQFAHGVNKHPAAIRNFLKYLNDSLPVKPLHALLIGKGIKLEDIQAAYQIENLIPTMGIPSSDNLFTAALSNPNNSSFVPEIPIGRLGALTDTEVNNYLSKVQQHESSGPAEWKKKVLHFIGSDEENLLNTISNYMLGYENTVEDTLFGANVTTFKKNTTAPIQTDLGDSINAAISGGAALMNFFGHGARVNLDLAIEDPYKFNNQGRYSFFLANSCNSGNIFYFGGGSVSNNYVFANQRGSIGYIATTSDALDNRMHFFSRSFYKAFSNSHYNRSIGEIIKETCRLNSTSNDSLTRFTNLQEVLHGDPSLRIGNGNQADYSIANKDLSFDMKKYADSVGIKLRVTNLGMARKDSFVVMVNRIFPNGDTSAYVNLMKAPYYKDSLKFFVPIDFNRGIGLNKFSAKIDLYNDVVESNENNNSTQGFLDLLIAGNDLLPVYPFKYAIVPKTNTITLKASTSDPFAPEGNYIFQLDTSDRYTSPLQTKTIKSKGGVLEWVVNLPYQDSTVYFWRVSRDSSGPNNSYLWKESSFQTLGNKRGWSQAHFNQFKNDGYRFVSYNKSQRKFEFQNSKYSVLCNNAFVGILDFSQIGFYFNEQKMSEYSCAPGGWNFVVFDSISAQPEVVKPVTFPVPSPGIYNNCVCVDYNIFFYSFGGFNPCGIATWTTDVQNFLTGLPPNNYVLAYPVGGTGNFAKLSNYPASLTQAFQSIGAGAITTAPDSVPYILFGRKGMNAGQAHETIGTNKESIITQRDSITTRWNSGYVASEIIGPAHNWGSLHWRVKSTDNSPGDTTILKLIGITREGYEDTLSTFIQDSSDILSLSPYINAANHPYLKLVAFMRDNAFRTSPQLKRWQVIYDEAAECAFNPLKGFERLNDTLMEGDDVAFVIPIENIGEKIFNDSLVITYWLEDAQLNQTPLPHKLKAKPFIPGQIILDTLKVNSYNISGDNALWIYANPISNTRYQNEGEQFNNIGRFPFKVITDVTNPLMDVTFDGRRILNGDIVSAKPTVLISLKDENKFLALNDTAAFKVFLQTPTQSQPQQLFFAKNLDFAPASLPKNSCSITYNPELSIDGRYTLVAQASDRSNNKSGSTDYKVQFEIKTKPSVTNVLNYPNPFSTSTRFVFTLTGSEVPEVFTIQIMTVSGKLVREITRQELGNLHIGRNITEYAWDGRDQYGDRLANGIYLYRVITRLNGNEMEKNSSGADQFFVKEFGKMVLMR